jgi:NTE family protein
MSDPSIELAPRDEIAAIRAEDLKRIPDDVISLCLSGGGFRAMLFHTGALWRLHQSGLLHRIKRFSSVSGGSIANGWLALKWQALTAPGANFEQIYVPGIRAMARTKVDIRSVLRGMLTGKVPTYVAAKYDRVLFNGATLQDLPNTPEFIFDASNLQSGALWRFCKVYMGDYKVGYIKTPDLPLSLAVAASSAFPPVLSPVILHPRVDSFAPEDPPPALQDPKYRERITLADGGVYDNLGLEPVIKRTRSVLVSDGGAPFGTQPRPWGLWPLQIIRVLSCVDNQVRALRKRDLIARFKLLTSLEQANFDPWRSPDTATSPRKGAYWGITTEVAKYPAKQGLACPINATGKLAQVSTRLAPVRDEVQERLINWGYAVTDYAIRSHVDARIPVAQDWPYPRGLN